MWPHLAHMDALGAHPHGDKVHGAALSCTCKQKRGIGRGCRGRTPRSVFWLHTCAVLMCAHSPTSSLTHPLTHPLTHTLTFTHSSLTHDAFFILSFLQAPANITGLPLTRSLTHSLTRVHSLSLSLSHTHTGCIPDCFLSRWKDTALYAGVRLCVRMCVRACECICV